MYRLEDNGQSLLSITPLCSASVWCEPRSIARATALPGPRQGLVLLWTVSICLDEFYKWARLPSTFEVLGLGLGLALALTS